MNRPDLLVVALLGGLLSIPNGMLTEFSVEDTPTMLFDEASGRWFALPHPMVAGPPHSMSRAPGYPDRPRSGPATRGAGMETRDGDIRLWQAFKSYLTGPVVSLPAAVMARARCGRMM